METRRGAKQLCGPDPVKAHKLERARDGGGIIERGGDGLGDSHDYLDEGSTKGLRTRAEGRWSGDSIGGGER